MQKQIFFIPFFLFLMSTASFAFQSDVIRNTQKVEKLKNYFHKSFEKPDSLKYRNLFFEAFPNSFSELDSLYGYNDGKAGPLYDEGVDHIIVLFNKLDSIPDSIYFEKLINVSFEGSWDADAINYFQHGLHQRSLEKPELLFSLLQNYPDKKVQSFFHFFYDGVHPPFEEIPADFQNLNSQYPTLYSLMKKEFTSALSKNKH
ncbi:MAG: hypothetical protein WC967_13675 [Balneolaceae bacterium]